MSKHLKVWALEELLDKERHRRVMRGNRKYIEEEQRRKQNDAKAITERGIPELDTKMNITLINHKYSPDRKLFPEQFMELRKAQGFREVTPNEKMIMTLQYMIPHMFIIFLLGIVALLDL